MYIYNKNKMDTKKTISISEARRRIFEIADEVQKPDNYYTLTEKGIPKAVIMSAQGFDSIMETMDILSDPNVLENIKIAEEELKKGEYRTWEELKKEIGFDHKKEALIVCEKPIKKYRGIKK
jgi:antitoxin YefM